jgi:hypothetical protein
MSPLGNVNNLRPFTFGQLDESLAVQQTEEAFAGASERPVTNVAVSKLMEYRFPWSI